MDVKETLFSGLQASSDEKTKLGFLNETFTFLHDWNQQISGELVQSQILSKEKVSLRREEVTHHLRQALELMKENMKMAILLEQNRALNARVDMLTKEKDDLVQTIAKAERVINRAKSEAGKARKVAINETRKNLGLTRDKICSIAETSLNLRELLQTENPPDSVINSIKNILGNIEQVADEMERLELWPETSEKPRTQVPISIPSVPSLNTESLPFNLEETLPSLGDVKGLTVDLARDPKEDPRAPKVAKDETDESQPLEDGSSDQSASGDEVNQ